MFLLPWSVLAVPLSTPTFPVLAEAAAAGDVHAVRRDPGPGDPGGGAVRGRGHSRLDRPRRTDRPPALGGHRDPSQRGHAERVHRRVRAGPARASRCTHCSTGPSTPRGKPGGRRGRSLPGGSPRRSRRFCSPSATPVADRVVALGAGNSIGMTVLGGVLLVVTRRRRGRGALAGFGRVLALTRGGGGRQRRRGVGRRECRDARDPGCERCHRRGHASECRRSRLLPGRDGRAGPG